MIKKILVASSILFGSIIPSQANDFVLRFNKGGIYLGLENKKHPTHRLKHKHLRRNNHKCSPRRALRAAYLAGLDNPYIEKESRRNYLILGRQHKQHQLTKVLVSKRNCHVR